MKAIEISAYGGPEMLSLTTRPIPGPKPQEVLIKVGCAGVNRPDILQRMGLYPPPPGASDIPGLEVAGTIIKTGASVEGFKVGDRVCALLTGGGYAEVATAHEGSCLMLPSFLSFREGAALPETLFTVWANIFDDAKLKPGETLLVHGGTSGIGVTAIGLARAFNAKVIATAGSVEKRAVLSKLGVDLALCYEDENWEQAIADVGGADVVLDMAGGDFVNRNLSTLNPGGRHVSIAFIRGMEATINMMTVMRKHLKLSGSTMKARNFKEKQRLRDDLLDRVWPLVHKKEFAPVLDCDFRLEEAQNAHARMESGEHVGKITLSIG